MKELQYKAQIGIEGTTPLLPHKCGLIGKPGVTTNETDYTGEWKKTVYVGQNGTEENVLVLPSLNMEACIRDVSKGKKLGKAVLGTLVASGMEMDEFEVPLKVNGNEIIIADVESRNWLFACSARIGTKRVTRIRAMLPVGWKAEFNLNVYNPLLTPEIMRALLDEAGIHVGLMDWRPAKKGKFGQFVVTKFNAK